MPRGLHVSLWVAALAMAAGMAAFNLFYGDLNQDEGWYLYAARQVAAGHMPYRDFAFTQGPMIPLTYAALLPLWNGFGVGGARVLTALLGLLSALGGAALAARLVPNPAGKRVAAFAAFCLIALNMYQSYFSAVVKTYSLCGLFLILGFLALSRVSGPRGALAACFSSVCLVAASATRLSAVLALPLALVFLWLGRRGPSGRAWAWFLGGGLLAGALVFLPFFLASPEGFRFGLFEYHTGRSAGGLIKGLVFKVGFCSRVVQAYFPACVVWVGAVLAGLLLRTGATSEERSPVRQALWGSVLAMTLVHGMTAFPYDDYQVPVYPLFAAAATAYAVRLASAAGAVEWLRGLVFVGTALFVLASPLNQEWFVQGRDRIWWRMKDQPPLLKLRRAAAEVRRLAPEGGELLTQDTYLAVEAGMTVPRGLELGPFSYFPAFTDEQARARHVVNTPMLGAILSESPARVAAFSGYSLSIRAPEVTELSASEQDSLWALVRERYTPAGEIPYFGQASTTLRLFTR
jgi:hypothetical protein